MITEPMTLNTDIAGKLEILIQLLSRPQVSQSDALWSGEDVAAYLGMSPRHVKENLSLTKGFPKAINLSGPNAAAARKRWVAKEIIHWAKAQR